MLYLNTNYKTNNFKQNIMENQELTPGKFSINYGLILGAIMIIISVITYATGMALRGEQWPNYIYYLIFPIIVIYAISQFKKANNNILSVGQAIKVGLLVAIISALVSVVYNLLFIYVIDPEFIDQAMKVAEEKLYDNPKMTEEIAEQSMKMIKLFSNPAIGSAFIIAMSALFGLIYSLIAGLIMKREA